MDVFVTYDAVREHAFVCFRKSSMDAQVAGYLDDGLYVEFGVEDPVEMRVLSVDHPFYARTPDFGDRLRRLIGPTIEARLREYDQRSTAVAEAVPVAGAEVTQLHAAWQEAVSVLNGMSADPWLARLSRPVALARETVSAVAERAGKMIREWRLPILLDPVVAREALLAERPGQAVAASAFSGMIELPAELAEILQAELMARADLARGVLNLRILLHPGSTPPPLMAQLADSDHETAAVASGEELTVCIPIDEAPAGSVQPRRVTWPLRLWVDEPDIDERDGEQVRRG